MDSFVSEHQDRSRNALQKSMEAAFAAFTEELKADQSQFQAEQLLPLGFMFSCAEFFVQTAPKQKAYTNVELRQNESSFVFNFLTHRPSLRNHN